MDELSDACHELNSCGLQTESDRHGVATLMAYFSSDLPLAELETQLNSVLRSFDLAATELSVGSEGHRDWSLEWRKFYQPLRVGRHIVVHPPWIPVARVEGEIHIAIEPAMAFGTGGHESTQAALMGLENHLQPGDRGLDVGTGSGILSIAAIHLGADTMTAIDVDPVAVANARHNVRENLGDEAQRVTVERGGPGEIAASAFDFIVANMERHIVRPLLADIERRLATGGTVLFSGMLEFERTEFEREVAALGLCCDTSWVCNGWLGLGVRRRAKK
ncbi:MAG: 50S ribosomal protein L11 methyltransferase [Candidatus Latescibacterota bacterium]|nr:50S ribosomal protein L11 methyltransferase [Candidatus Latescibacterota bacterium]